jgi:hypothetical protein
MIMCLAVKMREIVQSIFNETWIRLLDDTIELYLLSRKLKFRIHEHSHVTDSCQGHIDFQRSVRMWIKASQWIIIAVWSFVNWLNFSFKFRLVESIRIRQIAHQRKSFLLGLESYAQSGDHLEVMKRFVEVDDDLSYQ